MKKAISVIAFILCIFLVACGAEPDAAPAEPTPEPTPTPVPTGNIFLDAEVVVDYAMVTSTSDGIPKWAMIDVDKEDAKAAGGDDFAAFVDEKVRDSGYHWFTVRFDDATGLCFMGSDPANIGYGTISRKDGTIAEQYGVVVIQEDGSYVYQAFE